MRGAKDFSVIPREFSVILREGGGSSIPERFAGIAVRSNQRSGILGRPVEPGDDG
jgi:hypothetical protein